MQEAVGPRKENICAIIVTYHPDAGFPERAIKAAKQAGRMVIVDNHSSSPAVAMLNKAAPSLNAHLILNADNLGVAAALNQGVRWARAQGCLWALTLDQDTIPLESMVDNLAAAYQDCPFREETGMIGTNYQDPNNGYVYRQPLCARVAGEPALSWVEEKTLITSGSLLSIAAFDRVGPFREELFIDQIDHEYCLRLRNFGYRILLSLPLGMLHPVGARRSHKFLWQTLETSHHNPLRRYYMTRNRLILAREQYGKIRGTVRVLKKSRKDIARILLFEDRKMLKVYAIALGAFHGITGKAGRLPPGGGCLRERLWCGSRPHGQGKSRT